MTSSASRIRGRTSSVCVELVRSQEKSVLASLQATVQQEMRTVLPCLETWAPKRIQLNGICCSNVETTELTLIDLPC